MLYDDDAPRDSFCHIIFSNIFSRRLQAITIIFLFALLIQAFQNSNRGENIKIINLETVKRRWTGLLHSETITVRWSYVWNPHWDIRAIKVWCSNSKKLGTGPGLQLHDQSSQRRNYNMCSSEGVRTRACLSGKFAYCLNASLNCSLNELQWR